MYNMSFFSEFDAESNGVKHLRLLQGSATNLMVLVKDPPPISHVHVLPYFNKPLCLGEEV